MHIIYITRNIYNITLRANYSQSEFDIIIQLSNLAKIHFKIYYYTYYLLSCLLLQAAFSKKKFNLMKLFQLIRTLI